MPRNNDHGAVTKNTLMLIATVTVIVAALAWSIYQFIPAPTIKGPENPALQLQGEIGQKLAPIESRLANVFWETSEDGKTLLVSGTVPGKAVLDQLKGFVDSTAAESKHQGVTVTFKVTAVPG